MNIREGVMNSQWAGECGESSFATTHEQWHAFIRSQEEEAERNGTRSKLNRGDVVGTGWAGSDPDAFEVTEIVAGPLTEAEIEEIGDGDDRFVFEHSPEDRDLPVEHYLALTRYYEILEDGEES